MPLSLGAVLLRCALSPDVPFVRREPQAPWMMPPAPVSAFLEQWGEEEAPVTRYTRELELERAREQVKALGFDPDASLPKELPKDEQFETEDLAKLMDDLDQRSAAMMKEAEERRAEAMDQFRRSCLEAGIDPDAAMERARRQSLGPPKFSAQKEIETLRGLGDASRRRTCRCDACSRVGRSRSPRS